MVTKVLVFGLSLSAVTLFGLIYYFWPKKKYNFVPRSHDPLYYNQSKEGYIIWSPRCEVPDIKPFEESIVPFIKKYNLKDCSDKPLLTSIVRNGDSHTLILHDEYKHDYTDNPEELECCYSIVRRKEPRFPPDEEEVVFQDCIQLVKNVSFWNDEQFVFIECKERKSSNRTEEKIVYKNMHSFVRKSKNTIIKTNVFQRNERDLNVYIIGIDSVSRLNLIRSMPNTYNQLSKDWVELKGYNKVGYNTFPNLMAVTTGSNVSYVLDYDPLDSCNFIWKNLSKRGYVTMYAEDEPKYNTFNYVRFGFLHAPTDHYMCPFFVASEMFIEKYPQKPFYRCLGPEYIVDHLFNYLFDFTVEYQENPKFALLWSNSFSHKDSNGPSALDDKYVTFFDKIKELGVYESSLIVFLSDHGARFGDFRQTHVGWMEEMLPFIFFRFPEWWKKENPQKYKNLQSNSDKLTSPYDLYLTLRDALEGESKEGTPSCPNCRSLLTPIPWDRSCDDAGIPFEWCTCQQHIEIEKNKKVIQNGAPHIVNKINEMLFELSEKDIHKGYTCAKLHLKSVEKALQHIFHSKDQTIFDEYIVRLQTTPGDGLFEATMRYIRKEWWMLIYGRKYYVFGTISRLNKYGNQSWCILNQPVMRNYCFCQKKFS